MSDLVIRGYRLSRQHREVLAHVEGAAGLAAQLVSRQTGTRIDHTEIVVTTSSSAQDLIIEAHRSMFGHQPSIWKLKSTPRRIFGTTTITKAGVLVVINADRCQAKAELNTTLVHELVHAAQFSRPGARDAVARGLRNNYKIDRMSGSEARAANRLVDADEREAEKLERLASGLPT